MFFKVLGDIAIYLAVAISLLYAICYFKHKSAYKYLTIYLLVVGIIQMWAYFIGRGGAHQNNLFLSHYYFGLQFVCLSMFYRYLLKYRWIVWIMFIVLAAYVYQFYADSELYYRYNPWGIVMTTLPIVVYSSLYLLKGINQKTEFNIVSTGLLLYLLSTLLIFASGNVVIDLDISNETKQIIIHVNRVLYLIFLAMVVLEWFKNYNCFKQKIEVE